jgi:positive regulator of sigma E activity
VAPHRGDRDGRGVVIFGAILVLVGAWFLLRRYIPALDGEMGWPVVLVVIGVLLPTGALTRGGKGGLPDQG